VPLQTDDIRIREIKALITPKRVIGEFPQTDSSSATVANSRTALSNILRYADDRLAVVVGPCSIHDPVAAVEYARRLKAVRDRLRGELEIVMRVYFAKPRTTVGWKGLINDPDLDGSFRIDDGLRIARKLLLEINQLGLPVGSEFLDIVAPQYLSDLVAWGAIGARTTESQIHRELASGLSCPIGFKNGTDGKVKIAIDAVKAAAQPHHFLAVTKEGQSAIASTTGNADCHVILRGGDAPNYGAAEVDAACRAMETSGVDRRVMIDASHANSGYDPENQPAVVNSVADEVGAGNHCIIGVMIESNLVGGRQTHMPDESLRYGQSITDGCIDWDSTVKVLDMLARAVTFRRRGVRLAG
jgi:3-deoxy-7-phosphoheptulonate synthase